MGLAHSPSIVTNGLVLCLDAANIKSYPGSGTAISDLSGNGSGGTLTNGPTFSNNNGGYIIYDGLNDYIASTANISISNAFTLSVWINHSTLPSSNIQRYITLGSEIAVIRYDGVLGPQPNQLHLFLTTSGSIKALRSANQLSTNTWINAVGTWDGTTASLYKNGSFLTSSTPGGTLNGGSLSYLISANGEAMNGAIASSLVYDRALSADEVLQNYNALKGRFGL